MVVACVWFMCNKMSLALKSSTFGTTLFMLRLVQYSALRWCLPTEVCDSGHSWRTWRELNNWYATYHSESKSWLFVAASLWLAKPLQSFCRFLHRLLGTATSLILPLCNWVNYFLLQALKAVQKFSVHSQSLRYSPTPLARYSSL